MLVDALKKLQHALMQDRSWNTGQVVQKRLDEGASTGGHRSEIASAPVFS
jgi:hypothetical protein